MHDINMMGHPGLTVDLFIIYYITCTKMIANLVPFLSSTKFPYFILLVLLWIIIYWIEFTNDCKSIGIILNIYWNITTMALILFCPHILYWYIYDYLLYIKLHCLLIFKTSLCSFDVTKRNWMKVEKTNPEKKCIKYF